MAGRMPIGKLPGKFHKHSHFEFLLDESGALLKKFIDNEEKDPPAIELCVNLIEKSLAVAIAAFASPTDIAQNEMKAYEARRIRQPLCLALTVLAHLKWNLDQIHQNIPLHLQMAIFEELLKGYGIDQIPNPDAFKPDELDSRSTMVHLIYNRWIIGCITKYVQMKEPCAGAINNLPPGIREQRELQEEQILNKLKEYPEKSLQVLHKVSSINKSLEMPLPIIRMPVKRDVSEPGSPQQVEAAPDVEMEDEKKSEDASTEVPTENGTKPAQEEAQELGIPIPIPTLLDIPIPVSTSVIHSQVYFDLGSYYFSRGEYEKAWEVLNNVHELAAVHEEVKTAVNFDKLCGYYLACSNVLQKFAGKPSLTTVTDLNYALEESAKNGYKNVVSILEKDNSAWKIPFHHRLVVEKDLSMADNPALLFQVCCLNVIRSAEEGRGLPTAFQLALKNASNDEVKSFFRMCHDVLKSPSSSSRSSQDESRKERLLQCIRLAMQALSATQTIMVSKMKEYKMFREKKVESVKKLKLDWESPHISSLTPHQSVFESLEGDERIKKLVKLKSKLTICFDPEKVKDILFELHNTGTEQSHAKGFICEMYSEVIKEVEDLLMFDTVHVCITKAQQLSHQKDFSRALSLLTVCVDTLDSYATKASPGGHIARVKNILHHELLWVELKLAGLGLDRNANSMEATRRSKACLQHTQQDPPPRPHIHQAIVIYLLNNREYQFLVEAGANFDLQIVDFMQFSVHLSAVLCGMQMGTDVKGPGKTLWDNILKIVGESHEIPKGPPPSQPLQRARGPVEDQQMWMMKSYITKEEFLKMCYELKDEMLLGIILSVLSSIYTVAVNNTDLEIRDSYSHLWKTAFENNLSAKAPEVLSVLKLLCVNCLSKNKKSMNFLKTMADVSFAEGLLEKATCYYLEMGALATGCYNIPVPYNVWDDKIYKRLITCSMKEKAHTQAMILCQFLEPVDYTTAFKAVRSQTCSDGMDILYEFIWDVTILEYITYAHDKRGEEEKKKIAMKIISQPELNTCNSPGVLQQTADQRKTGFLRVMLKKYWR